MAAKSIVRVLPRLVVKAEICLGCHHSWRRLFAVHVSAFGGLQRLHLHMWQAMWLPELSRNQQQCWNLHKRPTHEAILLGLAA